MAEGKAHNEKLVPDASGEDNEFSSWMDDADLLREDGEGCSKWSKYESVRCLDFMKEVRLCLCKFAERKMIG